jgi:hypothetical protein
LASGGPGGRRFTTRHRIATMSGGDLDSKHNRGSIAGAKLRATEGTQATSIPLYTADTRSDQPEPSGWGPGGRRFKSCLPDHGKSPAQSGPLSFCSNSRTSPLGRNWGAIPAPGVEFPRSRPMASVRRNYGSGRLYGSSVRGRASGRSAGSSASGMPKPGRPPRRGRCAARCDGPRANSGSASTRRSIASTRIDASTQRGREARGGHALSSGREGFHAAIERRKIRLLSEWSDVMGLTAAIEQDLHREGSGGGGVGRCKRGSAVAPSLRAVLVAPVARGVADRAAGDTGHRAHGDDEQERRDRLTAPRPVNPSDA